MNNTAALIRINGKDYSEVELSVLIAEKLSEVQLSQWEKELYLFLQEWISASDTIAAHTSGSTGEPQMIRLPKTMMEQSAQRTITYFNLKPGDRLLLSLPCRYIAGKMMVIRAITGRMDLITADPSLETDLLLTSIFDLGAMVPNQVFKLLDHPKGKEKIENIRHLLIGGSAIQANMENQLSRLNNQVVSTYGMTETASHIALRTLSGPSRSDIYQCLPGITVSLGHNDCLIIHVPGMEAFPTKDIARVLSPVSFKILGRADDVIISGGIKFWPETLEKKLEGLIPHRFVFSSLPDEKLGEKLVLVVEGTAADVDDIQQKAKEVLLPYERPREICFLDSFPETENGKIKRKEIKRRIGK